MDHDTITLVQKSLKNLVPVAGQVGTSFYARLFETHPEVKPMFAEDIRPQARKLVQMLALVVNSLHRLPALQAEVAALARRHKDYGVADVYYPVVVETLAWTLQHHLGDAFTPKIRQAWLTAFATVSDVMIASAGVPHDPPGNTRCRRGFVRALDGHSAAPWLVPSKREFGRGCSGCAPTADTAQRKHRISPIILMEPRRQV